MGKKAFECPLMRNCSRGLSDSMVNSFLSISIEMSLVIIIITLGRSFSIFLVFLLIDLIPD
jgi:hypothetical protein